VPNDDLVTPQTKPWAINMLVSTPAGYAYTFAENDRMFRNSLEPTDSSAGPRSFDRLEEVVTALVGR
jgi:hypothetical protein